MTASSVVSGRTYREGVRAFRCSGICPSPPECLNTSSSSLEIHECALQTHLNPHFRGGCQELLGLGRRLPRAAEDTRKGGPEPAVVVACIEARAGQKGVLDAV